MRKFQSIRSKRLVVFAIVAVALTMGVGTALAVVPPSVFGYDTVCHNAGAPDQETLILRPADAQVHIDHGDPKVRCADAIPASAFDPNVDLSNGYHVAEIGGGLYWVTDGTYQMMFLVTRKGVIVVDAPPSIGDNILNAIADVTAKPVTHVVYSHSHADHIGGAAIFPDDVVVIAHEDTAAQLEEALSGSRPYPYGAFLGVTEPPPLPDKTFKKSYHLRVADQVLELSSEGIVHEPGNIFIYAPKQKTLMLVDVVFPAWVPFARFALAEDIPNYYDAYDMVLGHEFDTFVGGHLTRLGTRADVEQAREYVLDVRDNAALALQQTDFFAIAAETGFTNQWLLFDTYLDAVAERCSELTLADWGGVLGGADVNTFSHCSVALESLRID
jgi:glyoxylase-like metal-dependent hydrolase (beta-lactamase superfamily II)